MTASRDPLDDLLRARLRSAARALSYAPSLEEFRAAMERRRRRARTRTVGAALAGAAAVLVGGTVIGGSVAHHGGQGSVARPADASSIAAVDDLYARSHAALAGAHGVRIELTTARTGSTVATAQLTIDAHGGFALDLNQPGQATDSIRIVANHLYVRGPDLVPASLSARVGGRWLEEANGAVTFRTLLESMYAPEHLAKCLMGTHGTLIDAGPSETDGIPTERITSGKPKPFTIEIAREGTPYPVSIAAPDAGASAMPPDCGGITGGPFATIDLSGTEHLRILSIDAVSDVIAPASGVELVPGATPAAGG